MRVQAELFKPIENTQVTDFPYRPNRLNRPNTARLYAAYERPFRMYTVYNGPAENRPLVRRVQALYAVYKGSR